MYVNRWHELWYRWNVGGLVQKAFVSSQCWRKSVKMDISRNSWRFMKLLLVLSMHLDSFYHKEEQIHEIANVDSRWQRI